MTARGRAVWGWERPWQIKEYPVPEPAPGALLLELTLANICGSDLHLWQSDMRAIRTSWPRQWGHEGTGRVAALGEGVTADSAGAPLAIGDRVVFSHFFPCGRCRACLRVDDRLCIHRRDMMLDNWPHFRGTFGDYYYLFPNHTVLKVPDNLSDELVAGINCAMSQVICGWETGKMAGFVASEDVAMKPYVAKKPARWSPSPSPPFTATVIIPKRPFPVGSAAVNPASK